VDAAPLKDNSLHVSTRVLLIATCLLAAAHLGLLVRAPHGLGWSLLILVMTFWCLKCARGVLLGESVQALMLMSALMALLHIIMVLGLPGAVAHHATSSASHHAAQAIPMLAVGLSELVLTFFAAVILNRSRMRCSNLLEAR
jgi:hypothetical protein